MGFEECGRVTLRARRGGFVINCNIEPWQITPEARCLVDLLGRVADDLN